MRASTKKNIAPMNAAKHVASKTTSFSWASLSGALVTPAAEKLSKDEVTFVFRNLATLCGNGVPLPKALGALSEERNLERRRALLTGLRKRVESGDMFSNALQNHESSFDKITISQIRVGERSGNLVETLATIAEQRERAGKTREEILKKLAYPVTLFCFGVAVVAFLLTYVVPTFEETYRTANVPLPWITQCLIDVGNFAQSYWMVGAMLVAASFLALQQVRSHEKSASWLDNHLLKLPLLGPWLRDFALLQMMDVLGRLMEAGFTLAEALEEAADSVGNRAMKTGVADLSRAVHQGEKFSREVERHSNLFPPMVSQLIIVGEQTGKLTRATKNIREHLQEEVKRKAVLAIGTIEPVMTISMAAAVAVILLAIYLPMFDMVNAVAK